MPVSRSRSLVRDLMKIGVTTCSPVTPIPIVARLLLEKNLDEVIVLNPEDGSAIGMVTQADVVSAFSNGQAELLKAVDIMQEEINQILPDIPVITAAQIMIDKDIRSFFIMHHSGGITYPAAFISFDHILQFIGAEDEAEIATLGILAERRTPVEIFNEKRDAARRSTLK